MDPVRFSISWPLATGNHYKGVNHITKRFFVTKKAKAYRLMVKMDVLRQKVDKQLGHLHVHYTFHPPDKRRRDQDNLTKVVADALTLAGVWDDDSQVKSGGFSFAPPTNLPYIEVDIYPLEDPPSVSIP